MFALTNDIVESSLGSVRILHSERFLQKEIKLFVVSIEYNLFTGEMICYINNCYLTTNGIAIGVRVSCSYSVNLGENSLCYFKMTTASLKSYWKTTGLS